jgi:benzoate membrane transport protein
VLVGFTSSVAIVFRAAQGFGADTAVVASWMWALGWGMGLASLLPSLWLRKPVMIAWSTPGAAVLATAAAAGSYTLGEAVGAFMACAALITLAGVTGWFERVMDRIPMALANALLAGVLARFALDAVMAAQTAPALVLAMFAAWLVGRRLWPRYAVVGVLLAGIAVAAAGGTLRAPDLHGAGLTSPVFIAPAFTVHAFVNLALPLFVVTMASQNLPGVAVARASGYTLPVSKILVLTGLMTLVLAPFGGFALNLAAITAAICTGREAHPDPERRYMAAAVNGVLYCVVGTFGAAVAGLLDAFPRELVFAVAGLALVGTIATGLSSALAEAGQREPALVTFLVTLSGVTFLGVGSALWGLVAGAIALFVQQWRPRRRHDDQGTGPSP